MEHKTVEIDGKRVAYNEHTVFEVQVGHGRGAYKTRYRFIGNPYQAVHYYRGVNIGNGYKKRLWCSSFNKPAIAVART